MMRDNSWLLRYCDVYHLEKQHVEEKLNRSIVFRFALLMLPQGSSRYEYLFHRSEELKLPRVYYSHEGLWQLSSG